MVAHKGDLKEFTFPTFHYDCLSVSWEPKSATYKGSGEPITITKTKGN